MANKLLTSEECQIILENRFKTKNIKFISYDLKPISENSEGYMGEHYNLTLQYELYELDGKTMKDLLFMKQKSRSKTQEAVSNETNVYIKEIFLYEVLLKEFEKYGYDTSFAAKSYYSIPNQAIIMENIVSKGYTLLERNTNFDLNKTKCLLKALASYHGASFAFEKTKSKELGKPYKLTDDYSDFLKEGLFSLCLEPTNLVKQFWDGSDKTITKLIEILPKSENYRKEFKILYDNFKKCKIFAEEGNLPKTLGHGDLWSNNMMFKFDGDFPTTCCLLDFQMVRYFYPAFDVLLGIYSNTNKEFRKKYLHECYNYYYNTLGDILNNYGYSINDIMSLEDFYKSINLVKVDCLIQVTFVSVITCIPKEDLTDAMKNEENGFENLMFHNADRAVKAFETIKLFRKCLGDLLSELHNALVALKDEKL